MVRMFTCRMGLHCRENGGGDLKMVVSLGFGTFSISGRK
jgi:hypothetical protein